VTGVKICGLTEPAGFDAAFAGAADWIGFIFFPPSPRHVTADQAAALSSRSAGGPRRVGVFVEPDDQYIADVLTRIKLDVLQLYVSAERAATVRMRFDRPVWRGVGVGVAADLPTADEAIDGFVIDAKPSADSTRPGGNARSFDWGVLAGWSAKLPWLLGGGLTPGNVAAAIAISGAPGVDVSSGVERAPGVKDPALIGQFMVNVRG
jgi:phosphoribosylanthranilate isomerase